MKHLSTIETRKKTATTKRKRLGRELAELRLQKKISKYVLLRDSGLNSQQVDAIERGTSNYTHESLELYLQAIGHTLEVR